MAQTQTAKNGAPKAPVAPPGTAPAGGGWSAQINLAGSEPAGIGGGKDLSVPKGKYKMRCISANPVVKQDGSGKRSFAFKLQIVEPAAYAGTIVGKVNADPANEKAKNFWNTTLQSFGVPAAQLQKGPVKLTESLFKGKTCYMYLDPEKDSKEYDKREFMTPSDFEAAAWPSDEPAAPAADSEGGETATGSEAEPDFA